MVDKNIIEKFLNKNNIFAVIGASRNPEKYGYKVYKDLKEANYRVYPINPNADEILGDRCYKKLFDLPIIPDVIDTVTPPEITEECVKEALKLGINKIWMQPGSESKKAINLCKENNIVVLHGLCVMIERRR